jgi:F-type H+-transporting ATPase subunit epsilon
MEVSVATPERLVYKGVANDVLLNTEKGQINVLERHANLISMVRAGPLTIHTNTENRVFNVSDGVLKVEDDSISILCDLVEAISSL